MPPVTAPTTNKMGSITAAGTSPPSFSAVKVTIQPDSMKIPSATRLKRFTAYIKHMDNPQMVKGIARLMILPIRRGEEKGPRMNCFTK